MNEEKRMIQFQSEEYIPQSWDVIECEDECVFFLTNGNLLGPSAHILKARGLSNKMYIKYQGFTLEEVVRELDEKHGISRVENGKWKVLWKIIQSQFSV